MKPITQKRIQARYQEAAQHRPAKGARKPTNKQPAAITSCPSMVRKEMNLNKISTYLGESRTNTY
ncbi:MAG: hypothetical protein P8Z00_16215 [Anaerolineales bacterium]|jgi:hypothetical protein